MECAAPPVWKMALHFAKKGVLMDGAGFADDGRPAHRGRRLRMSKRAGAARWATARFVLNHGAASCAHGGPPAATPPVRWHEKNFWRVRKTGRGVPPGFGKYRAHHREQHVRAAQRAGVPLQQGSVCPGTTPRGQLRAAPGGVHELPGRRRTSRALGVRLRRVIRIRARRELCRRSGTTTPARFTRGEGRPATRAWCARCETTTSFRTAPFFANRNRKSCARSRLRDRQTDRRFLRGITTRFRRSP